MTASTIDFAAGRTLVRNRALHEASAKAIGARLFKSEELLEETALSLADLYTGLIEGRRAAKLSSVVGQRLIAETNAAQTAVTAALDAICRVHSAAADQVEELGLPRMDFGDHGDKSTPGG